MNVIHVLTSLQGRIGRLVYWAAIVPLTLTGMLGWLLSSAPNIEASLLGNMLALAVLWPVCAVNAKRWHDRDKSGWWVLIGAIPVAGQVWTLVECGLLPGDQGYNRYGEPPRRRLLEKKVDPKPNPVQRVWEELEAADVAAERLDPQLAGIMKMAGLMVRMDPDAQPAKYKTIQRYLEENAAIDADRVKDALAVAWGTRFSRDSFAANAEIVKELIIGEGGSITETGQESQQGAGDRAESPEAEEESEDTLNGTPEEYNADLNAVADFLFEIAMGDEKLSENEEILLSQLHGVFGFQGAAFSSYRYVHGSWRADTAAHVPIGARRQHYAAVLGIQGEITPDEVKKAFRRLAREYHPDKVAHLGPKLREAADDEMKKVNEAYQYFSRQFDM